MAATCMYFDFLGIDWNHQLGQICFRSESVKLIFSNYSAIFLESTSSHGNREPYVLIIKHKYFIKVGGSNEGKLQSPAL